MRRLRQVAIASLDRDRVVRELTDTLGIEVGFEDPAIGTLGLHNAVLPIGDQFLEVVAPVRDGTTAERYVHRRGGDTGYMLITQTDEHAAHLAAVEELGVRVVARFDAPGFTDVQLHPADTGGAFLEIDQNEPPEEWHPAGRDWRPAVRTDVVTGIAAAEIACHDPGAVAERWSQLLLTPLGTDADHPALHLDDSVLRFVPVTDDRGEGIVGLDLRCAADRPAPSPVVLGGLQIRFVPTDTTDPWVIDTIEIGDRRTKLFRHAPATLREVWLASAAHADRTFLVYDDERWTYSEAHDRVATLADRWVHVDGVRQGDRIAIACRNYPEWVMAFWATVSIGAVAVPLNAWWTGPELAYGLEHSGSVVLVADEERLDRVAPYLAATAVRSIVTVRTERTVPGSVRFETASATDGPTTDHPVPDLPAADISPDDDATIMYTSGTTGRPKGAVGTHRNMIGHIMNSAYRGAQAAAKASSPPPSAPPVTLLTFPLFHVGGLQSFLAPFTLSGGTIVLMYKWDARQALELIEREQVTTMAAVPTTLIELLELAAAEHRDLSSLGGVSSGATLVPPELVRRIDAQLEHRTAPGNGYGLTETSGAAIANFGADYVARPDSVGRPISPVMDVRIMDPADPDGEPLPTGEVGEIWLSGPTVVRGYFENPEATAAAFVDGWFRTGDLGRLDDEGFLYVVDRLKDVVIRGGENVYAAEVEAAIFEHPDVTEAAVFGVPHDRLGEEVAAAVRVRPGSTITVEALREHVAGRLAAFKVPAHVWLSADELPKNATGKVLKRELRDRYAGG